MTTDDAPRPTTPDRTALLLLAEDGGRNAQLWWSEGFRIYLWCVRDDAGALLVQRWIDVFEAAVLHALLPTKVREMP